jgi:hypothetical protein
VAFDGVGLHDRGDATNRVVFWLRNVCSCVQDCCLRALGVGTCLSSVALYEHQGRRLCVGGILRIVSILMQKHRTMPSELVYCVK